MGCHCCRKAEIKQKEIGRIKEKRVGYLWSVLRRKESKRLPREKAKSEGRKKKREERKGGQTMSFFYAVWS